MITLIVPYPPSANRYWQTRLITPRATGKPMAMTYPSPEAKAFKQEVGWLAKAAGFTTPLRGRVVVEIDLYPHRPLDWQKRAARDPLTWADTVQCIDLGNCEKVLSDALNGIAFEDDSQIHQLALRRMEPDGKARAVVRIASMRVDNPQLSLA